MGVPPNVQLHQAALNAQNPGAAMAPAPEPLPAVRSMDVVWSLDNPGDIGLVWRVAGEMDSENEDESEYEDEEDYVPPGHASVTWLSGPEGVHAELRRLRIADRSLVAGDIVAPVRAPLGQTGQVTGVHLVVDVRGGSGTICRGVPSTRLARPHPFAPGHFVVGGAWVGRIDAIEHHVTIAFDNGMVAKLMGQAAQDELSIWPLDERDGAFLDESHYHLYLGQRVAVEGGASLASSPDAEVLAGPGSGDAREPTAAERAAADGELTGTIIDLQPSGIAVIWSTCATDAVNDEVLVEPPDFVAPSLLRPLPSQLGTGWHLGDRGLLLPEGAPPYPELAHAWPDMPGTDGMDVDTAAPSAVSNADAIAAGGAAQMPEADGSAATADEPTALSSEAAAAAEGEPTSPQARTSGRPNRHGRLRKRARGDSLGSAGGRRRSLARQRSGPVQRTVAKPYGGTPVQVIATRTTVDIQWQDGSVQWGASARDFLPVSFHDEHDFAIGDFVEERDPFADMDESPTPAAPQAAKRVGWVKRVNAAGRTATVAWIDGSTNSEHSVYQLQVHPDFQFAIGDVVLRLSDAAGAAEQPAADGPATAAMTAAVAGKRQTEGYSRQQSTTAAAAAPAAPAAATGTHGIPAGSSDCPVASADEPEAAAPDPQPAPKTKAALRAEWMVIPHGHSTYYHNTRTGVSTWDKPEILQSVHEKADASVGWHMYAAWPLHAPPEAPHVHYWHHPETGRTQWEQPQEVRDARAAALAAQNEEALASGALDANAAALSCIGEVVGISGGQVHVAWADGSSGYVQPQQLFVVSAEDDGAGEGALSDDYLGSEATTEVLSVDDASSGWETDEQGAETAVASVAEEAGSDDADMQDAVSDAPEEPEQQQEDERWRMLQQFIGAQRPAEPGTAAANDQAARRDQLMAEARQLQNTISQGPVPPPPVALPHVNMPPLPAAPPPSMVAPPPGIPPGFNPSDLPVPAELQQLAREAVMAMANENAARGAQAGAAGAVESGAMRAQVDGAGPAASLLQRLFTRLFSRDGGSGMGADGADTDAAARDADADADAATAAADGHADLVQSTAAPASADAAEGETCVAAADAALSGPGDAAVSPVAAASVQRSAAGQPGSGASIAEQGAAGSPAGEAADALMGSAGAQPAAAPASEATAQARAADDAAAPAPAPAAAAAPAAHAGRTEAEVPAAHAGRTAAESASAAAAPSSALAPRLPLSFPQFDVAEEPVDHHFVKDTKQPDNPRAFAKRVRREWEALRELPPSIWVRAYESRTDLLRAAMVGPAGTPYHDGLFFFDIKLPSSYPATPPQVWYRSWGLRVNPNLYENGYVCLSLLNTWNGRPHECWNPEESTLLQVLVSIQGLVLVPEPYYNEAGYGRQVGSAGGARNSLVYNENAFLLSARSMVHCIRSPPADFRPLMQEHFTRRRGAILEACDSYAAGACRIGCAGPDADAAAAAAEALQQEAAAAASTGNGTGDGGVAGSSGSAGSSASGLPNGTAAGGALAAADSVAASPVASAADAADGRPAAAGPAGTGAAAAAPGSGGGSDGAHSGSGSGSGGDAGDIAGAASAAASVPANGGAASAAANSAADAAALAGGTSEGFRLVLAQLRPRLEAALNSVPPP